MKLIDFTNISRAEVNSYFSKSKSWVKWNPKIVKSKHMFINMKGENILIESYLNSTENVSRKKKFLRESESWEKLENYSWGNLVEIRAYCVWVLIKISFAVVIRDHENRWGIVVEISIYEG